jgi:excisionase family DNA binding protein
VPINEYLLNRQADRVAGPTLPAKQHEFTAMEVTKLLGVGKDAIHKLTRSGALPVHRVGTRRTVYYDRNTLANYLAQRSRGINPSTTNSYIIAVRAFTRWLTDEGAIPTDPLRKLKPMNAELNRRRTRRTLDAAQVADLLEATADGRTVCGVPSPARVVLYLTALGTGFHAKELRSLTPRSFQLDNPDGPAVTVVADVSKRRQQDWQPIRPDLAHALRPFLAKHLTHTTTLARPLAFAGGRDATQGLGSRWHPVSSRRMRL